MALVRFTRSCLSMTCGRSSCNINKLPVQKMQRDFSLGQMRMDKSQRLDQVAVDSLSKMALVLDGKYKTFKDVPPFLPYPTIYKARDKLRIKASIASGVFLTLLMIYLIRTNRSAKRAVEYEMMVKMEEAKQKQQ